MSQEQTWQLSKMDRVTLLFNQRQSYYELLVRRVPLQEISLCDEVRQEVLPVLELPGGARPAPLRPHVLRVSHPHGQDIRGQGLPS